MRVMAIYRTYDGDNRKPRPPYYSKLLAFQSFLLSWRQLPSRRLVIATNSPTMPPAFIRLYERYADDVRYVEARGNTSTYEAALTWVNEAADDDLVYFAEDDYLYHPTAFPTLVAAAQALPDVEYFTLYDHLDRYTRGDDARVGRREFIRIAGGRHWRVVESTCDTYAGRAGIVRRDARIRRMLCRTGRTRDRLAWRMTQGIGPFFWKLPKRRLMSPIPSLATHLDPAGIAPNVDWHAEAARTVAEAHTLETDGETIRPPLGRSGR